MGNENLLGYLAGTYTCEFSLSKTPLHGRVVFLSFPLLLTLSIFHYSPLFSAASEAPMQKLLMPSTWYFRNPISIGLWRIMLKISVVAGMRCPNLASPEEPSWCQQQEGCPAELLQGREGAWEPCPATLALCKLILGRAAPKLNEDNDRASVVISGHGQQGRSRYHALMLNHLIHDRESICTCLRCWSPSQWCAVQHPSEGPVMWQPEFICACFSLSFFSDFPSALLRNF